MQHLPSYELTLNLHIAVCRLPDQEERRGIVVKENELWLERGMQYVKSPIKYRITSSPEVLFVNMHLLRLALARMLHQYPGLRPHRQVLQEHKRPAHDHDAGQIVDGVVVAKLVGAPKELRAETSETNTLLEKAVVQIFREHADTLLPAGWTERRIKRAKVLQYGRATLAENRIYTSITYQKAGSRVDSIGEITYGPGPYEGTWVLEIIRFLKLVPLASTADAADLMSDEDAEEEEPSVLPPELRIAECNIFKRHGMRGEMYVVKEGDIQDDRILIDVETMGAKLI